MEAMLALLDPGAPEIVRADFDRMLAALWPAASRHDAVFQTVGCLIGITRTLDGALTLGPPSLQVDGPRTRASRFSWPAREPAGGDPRLAPASFTWDSAAHSFTAIRDAMGECPVWLAQQGPRLALATHPAPLLALPWVSHQPDPVVTAAGNAGLGLLAEESRWKDLRRLPAGRLLRVAQGKLNQEQWFSLTPEPSPPASDQEWFERVLTALTRAIARRLPVNGRMGAQLSGGLDSSGVALLASAALAVEGRELHTYSNVPAHRWEPPQPGDETPYVKAALARMPNAVPHFVTGVGFEDGPEGFQAGTSHDREVGTLARTEQVSVMLSGWGGDEGISYNGDGFLAGRMLRGGVLDVLRFCHRFGGGTLRGTARTFLNKIVRQVAGQLPASATMPNLRLSEVRSRLVKEAPELLNGLHRRLRPRLRGAASAHENQRRLLANAHINNRTDQDAEWSIPAGFCMRYPLLDPQVLSLALAVPERLFMLEGRTRTLLRKSLAGVYPELILQRHGKFPSHPKKLRLLPLEGPPPVR